MKFEELERELAGLRPRGVSPRLTQSVSEQLAQTTERGVPLTLGMHVFLRRSAVLAAAAALCGLVAWVGWQPAPRPTAAAASASSAPTMLNYQQAFAHSAESLEALLDLHAAHIHVSPAAPLKAGDSAAQSAL